MTTERDDGGPAFPVLPPVGPDGNSAVGYPYVHPGASLRDLFALGAMISHLITDTVPGPACEALIEGAAAAGREPLDHLCWNSYDVADAMLKARRA